MTARAPSGRDVPTGGGQDAAVAVGFGLDEVTAAVTVAVRAPSIHNTQPWSWQLDDGVLSLRADRSRQLAVADPDGHSLLVSCGAALAATEMGLRAQGWQLDVSRVPDADDPDLLAVLRGLRRGASSDNDLRRAQAVLHRRSERRPFAAGVVTAEQVERLRRAAAAEHAIAHFPTRADEGTKLAVAVSHADRVERRDAEYLAELESWLRADLDSDDGVPAAAVAHVPEGAPRHADVPLRDFEVGITGAQLVPPGVDERPQLAVVLTDTDMPVDQLAAGEATMRLMVEAELAGLSTCALSQAIDMLAFRVRLRRSMNWLGHPQMMLRIGPRPAGQPAPLTRRRPVRDVLHTGGSGTR